MEIFTRIYNELLTVLYMDYILAVVLTTFLLIKYVFPNDISDKKRAKINFIVGMLYGGIWHIIGAKLMGMDYLFTNLLISLLTTVTIYQWFLSFLLKKLGISYKCDDPELLKKVTDPIKEASDIVDRAVPPKEDSK